MKSKIRIKCPAKINLNLKITGKREDGFHNIESVMQTISLFDFLNISAEDYRENTIILSGNSSKIPYDETNLVYKAVKLFLDKSGIKNKKIKIFIEKNIPVCAGLAGGSTDAAGIIFGLNEMFDNPFTKKELNKLCALLGSDLNVCLQGGKVLAQGRGEIITQLDFEEFNLSLIKPLNLGITAKEAYGKYSKKYKFLPQTAISATSSLQGGEELTDICPLSGGNVVANAKTKGVRYCHENFVNDLEWAVIDDYKELQYIKNKYPESVMTGSGSTYFMINKYFENEDNYWVKNNLKSVNYGVCEDL